MEKSIDNNNNNITTQEPHPLDCFDCLSGTCEYLNQAIQNHILEDDIFKDKKESKDNKILQQYKHVMSTKNNYIDFQEEKIKSKDVSNSFFSAIKQLKENYNNNKDKLINDYTLNSKTFSLADTMTSSELCHPTMDIHYNYKSLPNYTKLVKQDKIKLIYKLDLQTTIKILDNLFLKESQFLFGGVSSIQTTFSLVYFHEYCGKFNIEYSYLSVFLNYIKHLSFLAQDVTARTTCTLEEDVFNLYKILKHDDIIDNMKRFEDEIVEKTGDYSNISEIIENIKGENKDSEKSLLLQLLIRLRFKISFVRLFNELVSQLNNIF